MAWYGLVNQATGELVSVGTEAMFIDGQIATLPAGLIRHDFGETQPDFDSQRWNSATRALELRPEPVLLDRRDDLLTLFQQNSEFMLAWNALNTTRRNNLRTGIRQVLVSFLGGQMMRGENDPVEL